MPAVAVAPNLVAPIAASSSSRVRVRIPPAASTQRGDVNRSCEDQFSSDLAIPRTNELIDLQRPFAVIAASILHHLNDDEAYDVAARIRAQLRPGCYVLISNFLDDDEPRAEELERAFLEGRPRHRPVPHMVGAAPVLRGPGLVEPGLVYANDWKPDHLTPTDSRVHTLYAAGVARKPE